jgi:hypothetical protein
MATIQQRPYRSYLLRLWQVYDDDGHLIWRASLESAQTGTLIHFSDLMDLVTYLMQEAQDADHHYVEEVLNQLFKDW